MSAAPRMRRRLHPAMTVFALLAAATAAAVYAGYRWLSAPPPPATAPPPPAEAGMSLDRIHQTATREGRTEWSLDAATARYLPAEKKVILEELSVVYFLKDGRKVYMTAARGEVYTETNDMEAAGRVVVFNDLYRLETEKIDYRHGPRLIASRTPVRITGRSGEMTADALVFDLNHNRLTLKGHVQGALVHADKP